jgi:hypothetical protein
MTDLIGTTLQRLDQQLPGVSKPGEKGYTAATSIWAKPVGPMPRRCPLPDTARCPIGYPSRTRLPASVVGARRRP